MNPITKWIVGAASVVSAVSVLVGTAVWAADTRYVTVAAQNQYEQRQLKRDIRRLELKEENQNISPEDKAFLEFLRQQLEEIQ